jgi:beta-xylosidase
MSFLAPALVLSLSITQLLATPVPTLNKRDGVQLAINMDFPDPSVVNVNGGWYAFATQNRGYNVQMARSDDWYNWNVLDKDPLPNLPGWVDRGAPNVWAPGMIQRVSRAEVI